MLLEILDFLVLVDNHVVAARSDVFSILSVAHFPCFGVVFSLLSVDLAGKRSACRQCCRDGYLVDEGCAVAVKQVGKPLMAGLDSGEEIAAICMALHEHLNMHDKEDFVLTINKVKRAYSPWNSKIYSLRELPHK